MADWRNLLQTKRAGYFVMAFVVVDGAGIYYADSRLNQPWTPPAGAAAAAAFAEAAAAPVTVASMVESAPKLTVEDVAAPALVARADDMPPMMQQFSYAPAAEPEVQAFVPAVKLAARIGATRAERYIPAPRSDRQFASAFASDMPTSAVPSAGLIEPAFGFAATAPAADQLSSAPTEADAPLTAESNVAPQAQMNGEIAPMEPAASDQAAPVPAVNAPAELPPAATSLEAGPTSS